MTEDKAYPHPQPTDRNPIIADCPSDTLAHVADAMQLLMIGETSLDADEESQTVRDGRYWLLLCLEHAVRFESDRVEDLQRPALRSVSS